MWPVVYIYRCLPPKHPGAGGDPWWCTAYEFAHGGPMRSRSSLNRLTALAAVVLATSCGGGTLDVGFPTSVTSGGGGSAGSPATYTGAIADSLKHGAISLTVSAGAAVSGAITFIGGPTVPLTGTADSATSQIAATGAGYILTGTTNLGTVQGSYTGSGGTGYFAAAADSLTQMSHSTYCGTYTSTNGNGWFSVVALSDGEAAGFAVQTVGLASSATFTGTIVNNATFNAITSLSASISGALSGDLQTITGTYAPSVGTTAGTGTFSASTGGC